MLPQLQTVGKQERGQKQPDSYDVQIWYSIVNKCDMWERGSFCIIQQQSCFVHTMFCLRNVLIVVASVPMLNVMNKEEAKSKCFSK